MKKLITFIVEQKLFSMLFVGIVLLVGFVSIPKLKISSLPVIEVPAMVLNLILPGASALEIEQRVIYEIEDELQDIKNLKDFDTIIGNGFASITIKYRYGVDINDEYLDVSSKINKIRPDLPDDLQVTLKKQNPTDLLIPFVLAIVSETTDDKERNQLADALKNKLMDDINTLDQVEILKPEEEVRVTLDLGKINEYGITINQIISAIQSENRFLPTGTMTFGEKTLSILPPGNSYRSLSDIEETILQTSAGNSIMLRDVSQIKRQLKPDPTLYRVNGSPATLITIQIIDRANILSVKKQLDESIRSFSQDFLPKGVGLEVLFNVEDGVRINLSTLITNLIQGMIILMVILLFAIGYRSGFIVSLMLPMSLLMATVCLSLTDFGLQQISIAGFIISLGLMVDNGIVVTEISYKLNYYEKYSEKDAAIEGTARVISPLVSSTLTTVLAFAPIFLLTSETGLFLRSLCITIWFCLGASLITAVSFCTILLSTIGTRNYIKHLPSPPSFLIGLIPFRDKCYTKAISWSISHPLLLLVFVVALLVFTLFLAGSLDVVIFSEREEPYFTITIESDEDSSPSLVNSLADRIEKALSAAPEIKKYTTVLGGDFPWVDVGMTWIGNSRSNASIFCETTLRDRGKMADLCDRLGMEFNELTAYATINVATFATGGSSGEPDVSIKLAGNNIKMVREEAIKLEDQVKNIPGIRSIDNPASTKMHSIRILYDKARAQQSGISKGFLDQIMVLLTYGMEVDEFRDEQGEELSIFLRVEKDMENPLSTFDRLFIHSPSRGRLPVSQFASYNFEEREFDIRHEDFKPMVSIDIFVDPGASVPEITKAVKERVEKYDLPGNIRVSYGGEVQKTAEDFGGIGKYAGIIALVMFTLFILQFKSIRQPFVVYMAIPLCFIGAFIILYIFKQPLSFVGFIGFTSLMGIVVNNSILLVDEGNRLRTLDPEKPIHEIAVEAGRNRFMPILLTSATTIAGLIPMAAGETMFKPLALVIIGGLSTSTVLTLICIPTLYVYLSPKK